MDLTAFCEQVGADGQVTIVGSGSRGGGVEGVRTVRAPGGIEWIQPDEMTMRCGAGTSVTEVVAALADHGQTTVLPASGTVGGALAVGHSDARRLGYGHLRDALLQARYISSAGEIVKAGGPTVKNVSGFDLCRLLVGSRGTLGFFGDVILRTRPLPAVSQWFSTRAEEPSTIAQRLHRPTSVLWNGDNVWVLLEGHPDDVREQALGLTACDGPPTLPSEQRLVIAPRQVAALRSNHPGAFVAEWGTGVVYSSVVTERASVSPGVAAINARVKAQFDPTNRLNPGLHA